MAETNQSRTAASGDDGLYTYDSFSKKGKKSDSNFLWWCAGVHQQLLKQFPSEHSKYSGLGGVLLATFVLASISAGYAVYSIFGNWFWTIIFAVIWGIIIFNFDRFLVSTMRKYGVSPKKQLWMAIPRMALALLIGITIARPLELKIFEKEVNVKMIENMHQKIQRNDSLLQLETNAQLQSAIAERQRLTNRKLAIQDTLHQLQNAYIQEADGTGGSGEKGIKALTQLKMNAFNQSQLAFNPELITLDKNIASQDSIVINARADMEEKRTQYEATIRNNLGFLERNKALSDLSNEESSVFWSSLMISLLIILIEIGPVLSKLIMPVGPYDIALAKEELLSMAADENAIREDKEMGFERKRVLFEKQKEMSDDLVEKVTALQKKSIDEELEKWERGDWNPKDHRASMDEVMRKIKTQYQFKKEDLL